MMPDGRSRKRRRKGRRIVRWLAIGVLATALSVALIIAIGPTYLNIPGLDDDAHISFQRGERLLLRKLALPLPSQPDLDALPDRLASGGFSLGAPIFMRIFKREFELEVWLQRNGKFERFATYPICTWSGKLGPKFREGDHQSPEGIYVVDKSALNPNSSYHRSFNLGYPNAFDRAHGRTGSFLMVHGACASVGCYAMTDAQIDEIWTLVTASLAGKQKRFQVQVFPFRMTDDALQSRKDHAAAGLWADLKVAHDHFEERRVPPLAYVCNKSYRFASAPAGFTGDAALDVACPRPESGG